LSAVLSSVLPFLAILVLLVVVHELGHFITAKLAGIRVLEFGIGYPPRLFAFRRGETEYSVNILPLGGFVRLLGEEDPTDPRSLAAQPARTRLVVMGAGSFMNFVLAVVLFSVALMIPREMPVGRALISQVVPDSPAARAGLKAGDVVVRIGGTTISTWEELAARIRQEGAGSELSMTVRRDGKEFTVKVSPEIREGKNIFGEKVQEPKIGIVAGQEIVRQKLGPVSALLRAGRETGKLVELTGMTVVKLLTRVLPSDTLGGPILIAQLAGDQARQGVSPFAYFLGLLSVNLGILNLLPIPILDGGHLLFFSIEALRRKPLSPQARALAQQVGLAIILMLTALVFYNDIARLVSR